MQYYQLTELTQIVEINGAFYPQYKKGIYWFHFPRMPHFPSFDQAKQYLDDHPQRKPLVRERNYAMRRY